MGKIMKKQYYLFITIFILFIVSPVHSQIEEPTIDYGIHPLKFNRVGTVGWQFLKIPTNARMAAMGDVRSSLGYGNANAAFANPASAADIKNLDAVFNRMEWVADISFNAISMVKSFNNYGIFGVHLIYVNYGDMVRTENALLTDQTGAEIGILPVYENLGTFGAHDMAVGLLYTRQVTDKLQVGGVFRYLEEQLDDAKTGNWAINLGTVYYTGFKSLRLAMIGSNFGPDAEFVDYDDRIQRTPTRVRMPMNFTIGAGMDIIEANEHNPHRVILIGEYIIPNDGEDKLNVGAEYNFKNLLSLRTGYRFNYDELGLTLGLGFDYKLENWELGLDYAYINTGVFNSVHMFSIGIKI